MLDLNLDSQPFERRLLSGQPFFAGRALRHKSLICLIVTQ
jgi:hypothetical protein